MGRDFGGKCSGGRGAAQGETTSAQDVRAEGLTLLGLQGTKLSGCERRTIAGVPLHQGAPGLRAPILLTEAQDGKSLHRIAC